MKIKDNTYYTAYADFIFRQLKNGRKIYTLYVKNPSIRSTLSFGNLHVKTNDTINEFFRVYNNFYIKLLKHHSVIYYYIV